MKNQFILAISALLLFCRCTPDESLTTLNAQFIGKWNGETGQFFITNDSIPEPIVTTIEFLADETYTLATNQINFGIGFLSEPNVPGKWDFDAEKNIINFFQSRGINPYDTYYWEIVSLSDEQMEVKVFDINNGFIRQRVFNKVR
jgi:hypothetical protein